MEEVGTKGEAMLGAIDTIKAWRKICNHNTLQKIQNGKVQKFPLCYNWPLQEQCRKTPGSRTDDDILKLVNKIKREEEKL